MAKLHVDEKENQFTVENIPLDPERLEIVKKILEQNQLILDFVMSPSSLGMLKMNQKRIEDEVCNALKRAKYYG